MTFKINPTKKETETKTVRFPIELSQKIEKIINLKDVSFSSFVIQACQYALDNLDEREDTHK